MMMRSSRTATVELLTRQGHLIAGTADGIASALAAVRQGNIDVLVLDMHMPNPEGDPGDAGLVVLRELAQLEKEAVGGRLFTRHFAAQRPRGPQARGHALSQQARNWRQLSIAIVSAWTRAAAAVRNERRCKQTSPSATGGVTSSGR